MTHKQAYEALEAFMDSENAARRNGKYITHMRNGKAYKLAVEAIKNPGVKIRTSAVYKFSQKSHQSDVASILKSSGIDFSAGNDAPKGGISGNFVIVHLDK